MDFFICPYHAVPHIHKSFRFYQDLLLSHGKHRLYFPIPFETFFPFLPVYRFQKLVVSINVMDIFGIGRPFIGRILSFASHDFPHIIAGGGKPHTGGKAFHPPALSISRHMAFTHHRQQSSPVFFQNDPSATLHLRLYIIVIVVLIFHIASAGNNNALGIAHLVHGRPDNIPHKHNRISAVKFLHHFPVGIFIIRVIVQEQCTCIHHRIKKGFLHIRKDTCKNSDSTVLRKKGAVAAVNPPAAILLFP